MMYKEYIYQKALNYKCLSKNKKEQLHKLHVTALFLLFVLRLHFAYDSAC